MAEIDPRFELARKRAKQASTAQTQQASEASKRRFAALGLGTSGAALKQEQQIMQRGAEGLQRAEEGIQAQEFAEQARKREIKEGREFQAGEALKGREFAAEQSAIGRRFQQQMAGEQRKFATGEREASQIYGAEQAQVGRDFQQGLADRTFKLQKAGQEFSQTMAGKQLDNLIKQQGIDNAINDANLIIQSLSEGFGGLTIGQQILDPMDAEAAGEEGRPQRVLGTVGVKGFGKGGVTTRRQAPVVKPAQRTLSDILGTNTPAGGSQ